ncbi:hypothetical protein [Flavobacterium sp. UMI-01]|uniref:hypothetical protein n=1 Tax=Flavobacterium sp. UMI-01 TaxID=1441053 RepID=UPI001C7D5583|nr:hypothetical protein [Flavobacterium sp. UMI-01]GIZ08640.1 hypothetical protein FUMI01_13670 [Flavobacterium sp. UMI-01]
MKQIKDRIAFIKTNGYPLEFEPIFTKVFENYKKIALYAGLVLFVFGVLLLALIYGGLLSYFGIDTLRDMLKPENLQTKNLSKEFLINYSAAVILFTALISPFTAGFIKMAHCADQNEEFHVSTIFQYYKLTYFVPLFIATFCITLINTAISTTFELLGIPFVGTVVTMLISLFTLLTIPLIIFGKYNAIEAIQSSILVVSKQPFTIINLAVVSILASLVGLMVFCIGVLFTIPFVYSLYYVLYKEIIGIE